jgi:hypothetical protein
MNMIDGLNWTGGLSALSFALCSLRRIGFSLCLDTQILSVVLPRSLEEVFPGDWELFFQALERDDCILRAAFDDDLASLSSVVHRRRGYV